MTSITDRKKITYADYLKIDDNNRYEIFHGELRMVPAPSTDHQGISINLGSLIWKFVKEKKLGKVFEAPTDVVFDDDEVFQPDIVFIKSERQDIIRENAIHGIPDLIVEIVSPSSTFYDMVEKKEIYRKYGVKEYWLVFPKEKGIEVLTLENGEYLEFCKSKKTGIVKSKLLEGLEINSKDVFE
ncbi:MAG: Uma2 family endonuclease [Planctomycetes bacterium]|nr:Uma2 family endonuclease [Planctomycetota bacterium]